MIDRRVLIDRLRVEIPARAPKDVSPKGEMMLVGPDVSHWQGKPDWNRVANGHGFAFCKATEGTSLVDPEFARNWAEIARVGLVRGAYHYGHPNASPTVQADHFAATSKAKKGDILALDLEAGDGKSSSDIVLWTADFLEHLASKTPARVIIYTGGFWKSSIGNPASSRVGKFPLWLAEYGPSAVLPKPWSTWTFWQFTDGIYGPEPHAADGIGKCDLSRFNGDATALHDFAGGAGPVPDPYPWPGRNFTYPATPMMSGPDIMSWQRRMQARGWQLAADGFYGPASKQVCTDFQEKNGLTADGIVGAATWKASFS